MRHSTSIQLAPGTVNDPPGQSVVDLLAQYESLDGRFPATMPESVSPSGKVIGPYRIEAELGRGGMGVVYRARDSRLDRVIALKMILRAEYSNAKDLHRFQVEALAVAKLQHPNIVQVYDVGTEGDVPYMALEYVDQGTLARKTQNKPQDARYAAQLVASMADGIQHAHEQGILHRDLKPANILLKRREADSSSSNSSSSTASSSLPLADVPVISDFGLAKKLDSKDLFTQSGMAVGTPNYMAPEQAAGLPQNVGKAADIYGLGAILYELLTGRPPFQGVNALETLMQVMQLDAVRPRQLQPKIPVDLETICLKCLEKDPARRYSSAAELAADLRHYLRDEVIAARPAGATERLVRWCRRHPAVAGLLTLVFLLLVAGATVASVFAYQAEHRATQLALEKENAARNLQRARLIIRQYLTEVEDDPALREMLSVPLKQKLLSRAMPIIQELIQESGDTPELITEQARVQWLVGTIHHMLGQTADAEKAYSLAIVALEKLKHGNHATLEQLDFLGTSYLNLGKLLSSQGRFSEAIQSMLQADVLAQSLLDAYPNSHLPKVLLTRSQADQSEVHRQQGHYSQASAALHRADNLMARPEAFGSLKDYYVRHISLLQEQAMIEADTGLASDAIVTYQKSHELNEKYHTLTGDEADYLMLRARINHQLGKIYDQLGQYDQALQHATASIDTSRKLTNDKPLLHLYQQNLAISYSGRAAIYTHCRQKKEANADCQQLLQLTEQLVKLNPTYQNKREQARAYCQAGHCYLASQQFRDCEKQYRESLRLYAELLPQQPGDTDVKQTYANLYMSLGNMLVGEMKFEQAVKEYEQAHAGFSELVKLCPDFTIHHVLLGGCCCNLGNSTLRLGQLPQAQQWLKQSMEILRPLIEKEPTNGLAQRFYRNACMTRVDLLARQGQIREAVAIINDIWTRPVGEMEKPIVVRMTNGVHDRLLQETQHEVAANQWATVRDHAELLCKSAKVSNRRLKEMLECCAAGLQSGDAVSFQAVAIALVQRLKDAGYFQDAETRQEFENDAALEPIRKVEGVKGLLK